MGSEQYDDEKPRHQVYLDAFYIDKYEVTTAHFQQFVQTTGHRTQAERVGHNVTWRAPRVQGAASLVWSSTPWYK